MKNRPKHPKDQSSSRRERAQAAPRRGARRRAQEHISSIRSGFNRTTCSTRCRLWSRGLKHTRVGHDFTTHPKTNSISRLAMRRGLGCSAVNCIAATSTDPHFYSDLLPEKDKSCVVTDHPPHSALEALWARRAGTFPFERPRIGRHWN